MASRASADGQAPEPLAGARVGAGTREEPGKTVLVVEDDWVLLELLRMILQAEGLDVLVAPNPMAAVALLKARTVDVVVTDFFSGTSPEACRRSLGELPDAARGIPILGVTGRPFTRETPPAAYGVDDLVAKPFDVDEVLERVRALLQR